MDRLHHRSPSSGDGRTGGGDPGHIKAYDRTGSRHVEILDNRGHGLTEGAQINDRAAVMGGRSTTPSTLDGKRALCNLEGGREGPRRRHRRSKSPNETRLQEQKGPVSNQAIGWSAPVVAEAVRKPGRAPHSCGEHETAADHHGHHHRCLSKGLGRYTGKGPGRGNEDPATRGRSGSAHQPAGGTAARGGMGRVFVPGRGRSVCHSKGTGVVGRQTQDEGHHHPSRFFSGAGDDEETGLGTQVIELHSRGNRIAA